MKPVVRSGVYCFLGYAGLVLMLTSLENRLVYYPLTAAQSWAPPPSADIEDVELKSADGTRIHAWFLPAKDSEQALLYFHGNAGNLSHRGSSMLRLRERLNTSVLIIDYPGYGKSEGQPTEQGCYQAGEAGYAWLTEKKGVTPNKIILYGGSLGGGIATHLAGTKDHRALVLVKTYTSIPDAACSIYWWLPVPIRTLMCNRFDNLSKIGACKRPVFFAHGTADEMIPSTQSVRLHAAANDPKELLLIPGNRHNDALPEEFFTKLRAFLDNNPVQAPR